MAGHARVVIVGGGAVGCSALYHLALMGWTDCVLLERDELTSGSTWHAAGNCPTFSTSWNVIKLQRYSNQLYALLAASPDAPITYHRTGSIRLAHSRDRMDEFSHVRAMARAQMLELELITPSEAKELYPYLELDDIQGALWDPYDGDVDPSQLTQAFAREARARGCEIRRFTRVTGLESRPGGGWRVLTDKGEIECEIVVNAAGYRAGEIMAMVGQYLPMVAMSHQYLVTEAIPELEARGGKKLPLLRDPDVSYYLRQERSGLLLGPYEWDATPHWQGGIPEEFANQLYEDDLDRLEPYIEAAIARVPILGSVGVQRVINGPIPYSPDGNPYVGPAHGLENFYQCCCFSFGIAQAGGAGKTLAEWVVHGEPEWDMWPFDPRRYTGYATRAYVVARAIELYQNEYAIAFPCEERPAGRPARTTALYDRLKAKGAMFGARGGWERATWFPREGEPREQKPSFRRTSWHEAVGEECRAVRERAGILDLGGFTRLSVEGAGTAARVDRLICTRLPKVGRVALAYMLNERGGIVGEVTITRLAPDHFHLLSAAAAEWHDQDWLRARLPDDGSVRIEELSGRLGTLVLAGPRSRGILSGVTDDDLSNDAFPWLSAREIEIGMARPLVLRIGYTGELGFELHVPMEQLVPLYDALWRAGEPHGIRDFGMYALESLRLEKCYRAWKVDIACEVTPLTASLDRLVDWAKPAFTGRAALLAERESGPRERLVPLTLDQPGSADAPACAPVWKADEIVGLVTSGGFGHALGQSIALAYLRPDLAMPGTRVEVEVLGELRTATVGREPLYDPGNERLRA